MLLPIGEAATLLGVHPDTLKGWGDRGPEFTRTAGGHRRYDTDELARWARGTRETVNVPQRVVSGWGDPALPTKATREEAEARVKHDLARLL